MPKKSAEQMHLFAMKAERKRKRRKHGGPVTASAQRAKPGASRQPETEPVQLDLIAAIDELARSS